MGELQLTLWKTLVAFAVPSAISLFFGLILVISLAFAKSHKKPPSNTIRYGKKNGMRYVIFDKRTESNVSLTLCALLVLRS